VRKGKSLTLSYEIWRRICSCETLAYLASCVEQHFFIDLHEIAVSVFLDSCMYNCHLMNLIEMMFGVCFCSAFVSSISAPMLI
jgi:hypothetical protein